MTHTRQVALVAALITLGACTAPGTPSPSTQSAPSLQAAATIPVGKTPHGAGYCQGYVYIGNMGSGSVSVIDTKTDTVAKTLQFGGVPSYTTVSPNGKIVANIDTTGKVRLIDPANGEQKVVQTLDVGKNPDHAHFSADSTKLAVTLTGEPVLPLYTFAQGFTQAPTVQRFNVGTVAGTGEKHRAISYEFDQVMVPNTDENNVSLVNPATGDIKTLTAGNSPAVVALAGSADNPVAVIGNGASNTVTVTRLKTNESKTFAGGTTPTDSAVTEDGQYVYITNAGSNDVSVIGVTAMKEVARIPVGKRPVHIYMPPMGMETMHEGGPHDQVWVMNDDGDSVTVIDAVDQRVLATVAVGKGHHKAAFGPTKAYITNITSSDVSVIDRTAIH